VDPVVRAQLQDEFLRLQDELGKTIVFVTHDIDEAVKLGDQVGVMRVGGKLAQLAAPAELLARPVDAFVASFVGRDRGYRALAFTSAGDLPTRPEPTVRLGADLASVGDPADGWVLVVDDEDRPQGWLATGTARSGALRSGQVSADMLNLGGTLATEGGSVRAALDAALSSPSGRGIVVDAAGRLIGSVTAAQIIARVDAAVAAAPGGVSAPASPGAAPPSGSTALASEART
jgi:osmoprotectant transport system ATP-binding protein